MTSTLSTVVNFTMLELLHRIRRIEWQAKIEVTLGDKYSFPSSNRASKAENKEHQIFSLPSNEIIEKIITEATSFALHHADSIGITFTEIPNPKFS